MNQYNSVVARRATSVLSTNKVLKNTYMLLSMTLLFSALMAGLSMAIQAPPMINLVCFGISVILLWFVLPRVANSGKGVAVVFAITGLLGFGLGPILSIYAALPNGGQVITTALGGTGAIFLALSAYVLMTKKDFSFLGGFLFVGFVVVLIAALANLFMAIPAMQLAISAAIIFIMSGFILFDTSRIIHGGETNYIYATIALYLDIYNIFINLLQLLGALSGDD